MATAKITLIGFSNYFESLNDDLFKFLNVPAGIDKQTLVNNILLQGGEFEVLYSDPVFLQNMIGVWSNKWQRTMTKWIDALNIEYNPLENYDRMEEWDDNNVRTGTTKRNESMSGHDNSISNSAGSGNTENTRSAYNSSVYQPHDNAASSSSGSNTSDATTTANTNGTVNENQNELLHKTGRAHGNIGVTTSQAMLQAEIDISKWNIYEEITNLFMTEFCIYL